MVALWVGDGGCRTKVGLKIGVGNEPGVAQNRWGEAGLVQKRQP